MMKIKNKIAAYFSLGKCGMQNSVTYKWNFLGSFLGDIFYCVIMYYIWKAIFQANASNDFLGFTMREMIIYIILTNAVVFFVDSDVSFSIGEDIRKGDIALKLIKPIDFNFTYFFLEAGGKLIVFVMVIVPVMIILEMYKFFSSGYIEVDYVRIALFLVSIILAYMLSFCIKIIFGYAAFFVNNIWGMNILKESIIKFFSGAIIPISFFPNFFQKIMLSLPFASLNYAPVMIYIGRYNINKSVLIILKQALWILVFYIVDLLIERKAMKFLCVQGG